MNPIHVLRHAPLVLLVAGLEAQETPRFLSVQALTNTEIKLKMSAPTGSSYKLEVSQDLLSWQALSSFRGAASIDATDSAAPYLKTRYYRIQGIAETSPFVGDHIRASESDIVMRPVNHASFVMRWNGKTIYNDPVGGAPLYSAFPKPDLILVSHSHGDHFDSGTLSGLRVAGTIILAPAAVYSSLSAALKAQAIPMSNGAKTNVVGIEVEAVPAYNSNHPKGTGNGYVVTLGGTRLYMTGDTGDIPEMRALPNIDVAFVCMNLPFTMTVNAAASAVREFRPKIVYPYHHSGSDINAFKRLVSSDLGIEVRLRTWY